MNCGASWGRGRSSGGRRCGDLLRAGQSDRLSNMVNKRLAVNSLVRVHFAKREKCMGFVVEDAGGNRFIITAAHCVPFPDSQGAGNIHVLVGVSAFGSAKAKPLMASLVAWEPFADIAVLSLETVSGTNSPDYNALGKLLTDCTPAPLCLDVAKLGKKFRVQICQHTGNWISGVASINSNDGADNRVPAFLWGEFPKSQDILDGTSGSPAFDDAGRVVAVVSCTLEPPSGPDKTGVLTCLAGALPGWILDGFSQDT